MKKQTETGRRDLVDIKTRERRGRRLNRQI
jgi:hypothetical protein